MSSSHSEFLRFSGHRALTRRLVLATLTGRPVHISQIRTASSANHGLAPHEISFLRLLEAVTNGSVLQVSRTGTALTYRPGLITGVAPGYGTAAAAVSGDADGAASHSDDVIEHAPPAGCTRGVTWFLLPLCLLAPFAKVHVNVRFVGPGVITSATELGDISVDTFRTAVLPLLGLFGIPTARVELRVLSRSCAGPGGRGGGGVVEFRFAAQVRLPKTVHLNRPPGRVRRVRGVAYCTGVSASNSGRMIQAAREVLSPLVADVRVAAQYDPAPLVADRRGTGKQRIGIGFGLSLVAETSSSGVLYSADAACPPEGGALPEDVGRAAAYQLLDAIEQGGCVSAVGATTVLTLMAMGSEDVGRLRMGRDVLATEDVLGLGRDLTTFGASAWGLRDVEGGSGGGGSGGGIDDVGGGDIVVSVRGSGVGNVGRKIA